MNPVNPKKLRNSKWTAVESGNREKHYLVTEVQHDIAGLPSHCVLEAVYSRREITLAWRDLADPDRWHIGWQ